MMQELAPLHEMDGWAGQMLGSAFEVKASLKMHLPRFL
jgi:hypothetical protein